MSKANYTIKSAKGNMEIISGYHKGDFKKADAYITRSKRLNSLKTMLETNKEDLERIKSGDTSGILGNRTAETIQSEIDDFQSRVDALNEEIKAIADEQNKAIAKARKLVTDCEPFMTAMKEYYKNTYADGALEKLTNAWRLWVSFAILNLENKEDVVDEESIIGQVYNFIGGGKNSNSGKCANHTHLKYVFKDVELADKALGAFCDDPNVVKVLPTHKWVNKIEIIANKASKNANK